MLSNFGTQLGRGGHNKTDHALTSDTLIKTSTNERNEVVVSYTNF